jgi:hypothetical protein
MENFTDYYALLGVESSASGESIKKAFKQLALQYHPDVYKGDDAQERMRQLLQAYQTLSDPEQRRAYDLRRSEHVLGSVPPRSASYGANSSPQGKNPADVSPTARRDRQRHYAFPLFDDGRPVHLVLGDISYDLPSDEARTLKEQGLLRGVLAMSAPGQCICHRCRHRWRATAGQSRLSNARCPKCQARDWREYLLLRCQRCNAVFESEQIRYEVGSLQYGDNALCPPYELFPLCPYCGRAGWCPAEEIRLSDVREKAARRARWLRLFGIE